MDTPLGECLAGKLGTGIVEYCPYQSDLEGQVEGPEQVEVHEHDEESILQSF